MRQLSKMQSALFLLGGLLMVIGAGCFSFMWHREVACWLFFAGSFLFAVIQMIQTYQGTDLAIRRLKRIQNLADIFFIISGLLMVDAVYQVLLPLFRVQNGSGYLAYIEYVYNKWVILLLIAAILEIYTTHRLASELNKSKNT